MADWKKLLSDGAKSAADGLRQATDEARKVADEARKVAGIGVGSIALAVEGTPHHLGDTLRGTVTLELTAPTPAKRLRVTVLAVRTRLMVANLVGASDGNRLEGETLFEHSVEVAGEQTFESGAHPFAVELPSGLDPEHEVEGPLGEVLKAARAAKAMTELRVKWTLTAALEIPWKRNVTASVDLTVKDRPRAEPPPAASPAPPRPRAEPPRPPMPMPPEGFRAALDGCLAGLARRGYTVIHRFEGPPMSSAEAMQALARHPDLDPALLQFCGVMNGLEILIGKPRDPAAPCESAQRMAQLAHPIGFLDEIYSSHGMGDLLEREFPEQTRMLEILPLPGFLDNDNPFGSHEGRPMAPWCFTFGYGDHLGLITSEEIRRWRQPPRGESGREESYDLYATDYQRCLDEREREREHPGRWWVVRGDDHAAGLYEPPWLLTWSETLTACLDHLARG